MRSYRQLTPEQRYQIYALRQAQHGQADVATILHVHPSTVARELKRNTGQRGYRPKQAQELAQARQQQRARQPRIAASVWDLVRAKLIEEWSPEQIAGWLAKAHQIQVSHERIYQYVYTDQRHGGALYRHLRCQKQRRKRYGQRDRRGQLANRRSITERPAIVDQRQRLGDWEADTIVGKGHQQALVSLTERKSKLTLLAKVEHATAAAVGQAVTQLLASVGGPVHTITSDNGREFAQHEAVAATLAPALEEEGIELRTAVSIERVTHDGRGWRLDVDGGEDVRADELLVATGREVCLAGHDLAAAGVSTDDEGRPVLNETLRTTSPHIWAAGDATGDLLFTHVGAYEAGLVVADILGRPRARDYRVVPRVTFCDPEVASVGLTEEKAREASHEVRISVVPIAQNERASIDGARHGVVKLVADAASLELLGGHIVGEEAGAMIHEVVAMMAGRLVAPTIGDAIHAYPTLSESVKAAAAQLTDA